MEIRKSPLQVGLDGADDHGVPGAVDVANDVGLTGLKVTEREMVGLNAAAILSMCLFSFDKQNFSSFYIDT
jgi:hypothetical protein